MNHWCIRQEVSPGNSSGLSVEVAFVVPEAVGFWGVSGRGKSSLMLALCGLRQLPGLSLEIDGENTACWGPARWARYRRRHLGLVFQDLRLLEERTVAFNLLLNCPPHRRLELREKMANWMETLRLGKDCLERPVGSLSLGQRQRVALLRALAGDFSWLVLDEPFAHLDEETACAAAHLLERERQSRSAGVLLFAHAPESALPVERWIPLLPNDERKLP
jgi:ABC-type lipoprotein export system ATPase subunit